jgi:UDP-N-acetylmuramate--alanine ligase
MTLTPGQHIHLVGIGGSGLSAIARVLLGQGYTVSGSDRGSNELMDALAHDGAAIYHGHDARYIEGADALIISSAVKPDHVEVAAAHSQNVPVYKRQHIMADLMVGKRVIAVAGTKGKTTTTSMIVHILRECGLDPSYIVGGVMGNTGTNAGVGKGDLFVVEADEYDNMFLGLKPDIAVITNVEWDHPDFFKTHEEMIESFRRFIGLLPRGGILVACADDPTVLMLATERPPIIGRGPTVTYGINNIALYRAANVHVDKAGYTAFDIVESLGEDDDSEEMRSYPARIGLPGIHNVRNALAALASVPGGHQTFSYTVPALATFKPTARRFDLRADVNQIAIIDDYAHNPTSIRVTIDAAKQRYPDRNIWAVWQPHTYSRIHALIDDFLKAFDAAHHVLITDIYAAREAPMPGVTSAAFVARMQHPDVRHTPTFADVVTALNADVQSPAVVLIMSAGDAPQIGVEYLKHLQERAVG